MNTKIAPGVFTRGLIFMAMWVIYLRLREQIQNFYQPLAAELPRFNILCYPLEWSIDWGQS